MSETDATQETPRAVRYHARFDSLQGDRARSSNSVYFHLPYPGDDDKAMRFAKFIEAEVVRGVLVSLNKNLFLQEPPVNKLPSGTNEKGEIWQLRLLLADANRATETLTFDYYKEGSHVALERFIKEIGLVNRWGNPIVRIPQSTSSRKRH
jgi:hypothetical protein